MTISDLHHVYSVVLVFGLVLYHLSITWKWPCDLPCNLQTDSAHYNELAYFGADGR